MELLQKILQAKTEHCNHVNGCIHDALKTTLSSLKYGLIVSSVLQLIKSLRALAKSPSMFSSSFSPEYLTIAIFMSCTTLVLRLLKCLFRWARNTDDGLNSFVAGCIAGWIGTKTLSKNYWGLFVMFIGSRVIGVVHQFLLSEKILDKKNINFHYYLMFFVAHAVNSYGYFI